MIAALALVARILKKESYLEHAREASALVKTRLTTADGKLLHRYRQGKAGLQANIDDYAFYTWGLLELYAATFEEDYLEDALHLTEALLDQFWDDDNGGLFFTPEDGEPLLVRPKEAYDGAAPSGNSVAMMNLVRLAAQSGIYW